jgi:hypothetical protein
MRSIDADTQHRGQYLHQGDGGVVAFHLYGVHHVKDHLALLLIPLPPNPKTIHNQYQAAVNGRMMRVPN